MLCYLHFFILVATCTNSTNGSLTSNIPTDDTDSGLTSGMGSGSTSKNHKYILYT